MTLYSPTESSILHYLLDSKKRVYFSYNQATEELMILQSNIDSLRKEYFSLQAFLKRLDPECGDDFENLLLHGKEAKQIFLKVHSTGRDTESLLTLHWYELVHSRAVRTRIEGYLEPSTSVPPISIGQIQYLDSLRIQALKDDFEEEFEKVFDDIVREFFVQSEETLKQVQEQIQKLDFERVQKSAHLIKGASANVGLKSINQSSVYLELACKEKNLEKVLEAFTQLQDSNTKTKNYLKV